MKKLLLFLLIAVCFSACDTINIYEKTKAFPKHAWSSKEKLSFNFTITDTTAPYNIFAVLRHEDAYHFNNIWLSVTTINPEKKTDNQRIELKLGDNNKWFGNAMDDIIEQRILLTKFPVKLKAGEYTFTLQQIMREDPLPNMLNAGIRVEKAVQ
ncbi:gliding motility lipoprotein GldH [Panacibacter sp. DH6]|uniref:Gliding motility lipoprotein GldH n=1 Tax=Panacibacter microcysteis TaxID=2793269 RepID=A0A931E638_9BACT|nr:gliding motility lipoprotein GldH [Panacibacter microcysteis]MBG9375844.1 gliding motility lipoprotein GldH [Panacibacter microcysteis]